MDQLLDIVYKDEHLLVINKPIGLPVHKTQGMPHDAPYVTKVVGLELGGSVYNVHRLDAKTSGILLLARTPEVANQLTGQFANRLVGKTYVAIVKGVPPAEGTFDLPVRKARKGKKAASITHYQLLETIHTGWAHREEDNQALSLLQLQPETGRWHQLRQHCAQQRYDIIGDPEHGDYALNRLVADHQGFKRLYLHASQLRFTHPLTTEVLDVSCPVPDTFEQLMSAFRS